MDEGKKKSVMIGVIVVCLGAAAYITFRGGGGGGEIEVPEDATIWVKCRNRSCNAVYEMNERAYRDFTREHILEETTPGMVCEKCGKASAFKGIKCVNVNCGYVFFYGDSGRNDLADRCPKCKVSAREESQK